MKWEDFVKYFYGSEKLETKEIDFNIKHIHCNPKAKVTVVIFADNSKEICRCAEGDEYNEYAGICICIAKHLYGKSRLDKIINDKISVSYNKNNKKEGAK